MKASELKALPNIALRFLPLYAFDEYVDWTNFDFIHDIGISEAFDHQH